MVLTVNNITMLNCKITMSCVSDKVCLTAFSQNKNHFFLTSSLHTFDCLSDTFKNLPS